MHCEGLALVLPLIILLADGCIGWMESKNCHNCLACAHGVDKHGALYRYIQLSIFRMMLYISSRYNVALLLFKFIIFTLSATSASFALSRIIVTHDQCHFNAKYILYGLSFLIPFFRILWSGSSLKYFIHYLSLLPTKASDHDCIASAALMTIDDLFTYDWMDCEYLQLNITCGASRRFTLGHGDFAIVLELLRSIDCKKKHLKVPCILAMFFGSFCLNFALQKHSRLPALIFFTLPMMSIMIPGKIQSKCVAMVSSVSFDDEQSRACSTPS